jgi:hypothetical protein
VVDRLIEALVRSENLAADDALLEALRLGSEPEQHVVLDALLRRKSDHGLTGVIERFDGLPETVQEVVIREIGLFHHALHGCGRGTDYALRRSAMKLIALGRQGKLAYVLSENLNDPDDELSVPAVQALISLALWASQQTHRLQREYEQIAAEERQAIYRILTEQRPEIESALARAMGVYRSKHGVELLRAALLVCDWPGSKTLGILHTTKHVGQSPMVRRLQQPPPAEHVEAFLLGASHGGLRSHFGSVFSHVAEAPVLDGLLRKTHWLKDQQLQLCVHQVARGTWWAEDTLVHDCAGRDPQGAALVGEWLAASGLSDTVQDERLKLLLPRLAGNVAGRLRLLRIGARRRRGASVELLRTFLADPDERIVRMAAREIVRRRPADFENMLIQLMTGAPESVRRVVRRAIGQAGFDQYWMRFDKLDRATRRAAGRAMLKLLPDAPQRLARRLAIGPVEQRIKAMQMAGDLGLIEALRAHIFPLCNHPHPRVRSKAVLLLGDLPSVSSDLLLDKVLLDGDARVRANAIEVVEGHGKKEYVPLLTERARSSHNRERANAIKALHKMRIATATTQLLSMLRDERSEHRISAIWAMREMGVWQLLAEVGNIAKQDRDLRVRRYALNALRGAAELLAAEKIA